MIRVLACIHDFDLLRALMEQLSEYAELIIMTDLPQDMKTINALKIDVCLLDCTQDLTVSLAFASKLNLIETKRIRVVYMFQRKNQQILEHIEQAPIDSSYLFPPFAITKVIRELLRVSIEVPFVSLIRMDEESIAIQEILDMGIPVHLNGFRFIKTAALLLLHSDKEVITMKQLYKETARIYRTTTTRVEKAIRDAIEYAYRISPDLVVIQGRKPTNAQLIHLVQERISIQLQSEAQAVVS